MKSALSFVLALSLQACGGGADPGQDSVMDAPPSASLAVDLHGFDLPLTVEFGDPATLGVDSPSVRMNEDMGQLEVQAGDRFSILITEEPGDIARLKADLERDPLRTSAIIEEQPDRLVWRSSFPDEEIVFVHFYRVLEVDGRTFVAQDDDRGRYNEADIARMIGSVRIKQPV